MATTHWSDRLVTMGACSDAVAWARTQPNLTTAWARCERGDWMLWLAGRRIGKDGSVAHRRVVKATSACARLALPIFERQYPEDKRPRRAILAAERWALVPSDKNRAAAAALAAYAASAYAASAYAYAASASAASAFSSAASAYAASVYAYAASTYAAAASTYAASASAYAASPVPAPDAYAAAARSRSLKRSAAIVRRIVPCPRLGRA